MRFWLRGLKTQLLQALMSAAYLAAALLLWVDSMARWHGVVLAILMGAALLAWFATRRRYQLVADTPTAAVASAHQGYVELVGRSELHPGAPGIGLSSMPPSVWYRYVVHRREPGGNWVHVDAGQSDETFLLMDGSGSCVVDPDHAEVLGSHHAVYHQRDYRHEVDYLLPGEPLYVLGAFTTVGGAAEPVDERLALRELLRAWKRDLRLLRSRFDFNGDGHIDPAEWRQVRAAAKRRVESNLRELRLQPGVQVIRAPEDGRPFLISNRDPERLLRGFRFWSWVHMAVFSWASMTALMRI